LTRLAKWDFNFLNTPVEKSCNRLHFDIKTYNNKALKSYDSICKKIKKMVKPPNE